VAVECYIDHFEMYLTDLLRTEGSVERRRLFEQFVRGAAFVCGRCRQEFEMKPDGIEEDDEVLCPQCRRKD